MIALLVRGLEVLSEYCENAILFAEMSGVEPTALTGARLLPDDPTLGAQIERLVDFIVGAGQALSGLSPPVLLHAGNTFSGLKQHVALALRFLHAVSIALPEDDSSQAPSAPGRSAAGGFGDDNLLSEIVPRVLTDLTRIHNALRLRGVPLGPPNFMFLPMEYRSLLALD